MRGSEAEIEFLSFADVCAIHDRALAEFGEGLPGFLDEHTVRSAASQPEAGIAGKYFYEFPAGMAAAYLYFLTNQQGFVNGNKRTAVGSALEFLARNGYRLKTTPLDLYQMTVNIAGEDAKGDRRRILAELTKWIEERLVPVE
jgi:death-on-curing protein